jgi:hypothetical protein
MLVVQTMIKYNQAEAARKVKHVTDVCSICYSYVRVECPCIFFSPPFEYGCVTELVFLLRRAKVRV